MAVKNSAGVKFNDATELIIQADPDGTVESCFNLSNNTEYVGGLSTQSYTLKLTNNFGSMIVVNHMQYVSDYAVPLSYSVANNITSDISCIGGTYVPLVTNGAKFEIISGEAELAVSDTLLKIKGECQARVVVA